MLSIRLLTLVLGLLTLNSANAIQAAAQTTISFTEFPVNTQISEQYVNKGVLFSSTVGTPIISKDNLITGKVGLCALGRRTMGGGIFAVEVNACESVYVGFVYPNKKMVSNFASDIKIKVLAVGAVTAHWRDSEGNIQDAQASVSADEDPQGFLSIGQEMEVSIPDETEGVLLTSADSNCGACNFTVTRVSFALSQNSDPICDRPVTDAAFSWQRLANEDYPEALYRRLDEFRKPGQPLKIEFQYLKAGKKTYYDEFAIIVKLPADDDQDLAQEIFATMRRKLDTVGLGEAAIKFQATGKFSYFEPDKIASRPDKLPLVGDIFQVSILPKLSLVSDNGDVMMTELLEAPEHSRFRYSTLSNHLPGGNWTHPNNGSREYGYFKTLDGWTKFYVRGIDQFDFEKAADLGAETSQSNFWLNFLTGIGNQVKFRKGEIVYPAFKTVDETLKGPPKCHVPPRTGYGA